MLQPGDSIIYCIKADGWNTRTRKTAYTRKYSFYGKVVEVFKSTATLDLQHPRTQKVIRKTQCPVRNIRKIEINAGQ